MTVLAAAGETELALRVDADNRAARRFYAWLDFTVWTGASR